MKIIAAKTLGRAESKAVINCDKAKLDALDNSEKKSTMTISNNLNFLNEAVGEENHFLWLRTIKRNYFLREDSTIPIVSFTATSSSSLITM